MGFEFNQDINCWMKNREFVPNWTPDDVKLGAGIQITNQSWINKILGIKKEENMNEKDTKIIVEQLEEKLKTLHKCKDSWMRQMAIIGSKLNEWYVEIDSLESVLEKLVDEDDEDDDE